MAIPARAQRWPESMDPGDIVDYGLGFGEQMLQTDEGEEIDPSNWTILPSADAVLAGLQVKTGGGRDPALFHNNQSIGMWFGIDPANQADPGFDTGIECALKIVFQTTSVPFRQYERTFVVRVENL